MIIYEKGGFDGPAKLFRIHGSAVYKSILPAILSTIISFMYDDARFDGMNKANVPFVKHIFPINDGDEFYTVIRHPYTINAFIAIFRYDTEKLSSFLGGDLVVIFHLSFCSYTFLRSLSVC